MELEARYSNPKAKVGAPLKAVGLDERDILQSVGLICDKVLVKKNWIC